MVLSHSLALARLVAASYSEDNYGVVQKDIPKVLESMLGLLMALESFLLKEAGSAKFQSNPYSAQINAQRLAINRSYAILQGKTHASNGHEYVFLITVFHADK
jgi:hypothetical protein